MRGSWYPEVRRYFRSIECDVTIDMPTAAPRKARDIAIIAVAGAPSFLFLGVALGGKRFADRVTIGGSIVAALTARVIILGMCGMRVSFVLPA